MNKVGYIHIITPIFLIFILYFLLITLFWTSFRQRTILPLYAIFLAILFPPAFFYFIFFIFVIQIGMCGPTFWYIPETQPIPESQRQVVVTVDNGRPLSQMGRRMNRI